VAPETVGARAEPDFLASWRAELLERTWQALAEANATYHAVLLLRVNNTEMTSAQLAERLSVEMGKPFSALAVRKSLERAHRKFAELLLEEVALSLETNATDLIEDEMRELDLLRYCRSVWERQKKKARELLRKQGKDA
jgi:hypothetical protein